MGSEQRTTPEQRAYLRRKYSRKLTIWRSLMGQYGDSDVLAAVADADALAGALAEVADLRDALDRACDREDNLAVQVTESYDAHDRDKRALSRLRAALDLLKPRVHPEQWRLLAVYRSPEDGRVLGIFDWPHETLGETVVRLHREWGADLSAGWVWVDAEAEARYRAIADSAPAPPQNRAQRELYAPHGPTARKAPAAKIAGATGDSGAKTEGGQR